MESFIPALFNLFYLLIVVIPIGLIVLKRRRDRPYREMLGRLDRQLEGPVGIFRMDGMTEVRMQRGELPPKDWEIFFLDSARRGSFKKAASHSSVTLQHEARIKHLSVVVDGESREVIEGVMPGFLDAMREIELAMDDRVWLISFVMDRSYCAWRWGGEPDVAQIEGITQRLHRAMETMDWASADLTEALIRVMACADGAVTVASWRAASLLVERTFESEDAQITDALRGQMLRWDLGSIVALYELYPRAVFALFGVEEWHALLTEAVERRKLGALQPGGFVALLGALHEQAGPEGSGPRAEAFDALLRDQLMGRLHRWLWDREVVRLFKQLHGEPHAERVEARAVEVLAQLVDLLAVASEAALDEAQQHTFQRLGADQHATALLAAMELYGGMPTLRWISSLASKRGQLGEWDESINRVFRAIEKRGEWRDNPAVGAISVSADAESAGALSIAETGGELTITGAGEDGERW